MGELILFFFGSCARGGQETHHRSLCAQARVRSNMCSPCSSLCLHWVRVEQARSWTTRGRRGGIGGLFSEEVAVMAADGLFPVSPNRCRPRLLARPSPCLRSAHM